MISIRTFLLFVLLCSVVNMRLVQDFIIENEDTTHELACEGEDDNENNQSEETDESVWLLSSNDFFKNQVSKINSSNLTSLINIIQDYKSPYLERKYSPPRFLTC